MMTQPIRYFLDLTSEPAPVSQTKAPKPVLSGEDLRMFEMRARYARAQLVGDFIATAIIWVGQKAKALVAWIKADMKLRAAETQLLRMSDRELSDLGLCRSDIHFAVREATYGIAPEIAEITGHAVPANQNLRHAA